MKSHFLPKLAFLAIFISISSIISTSDSLTQKSLDFQRSMQKKYFMLSIPKITIVDTSSTSLWQEIQSNIDDYFDPKLENFNVIKVSLQELEKNHQIAELCVLSQMYLNKETPTLVRESLHKIILAITAGGIIFTVLNPSAIAVILCIVGPIAAHALVLEYQKNKAANFAKTYFTLDPLTEKEKAIVIARKSMEQLRPEVRDALKVNINPTDVLSACNL